MLFDIALDSPRGSSTAQANLNRLTNTHNTAGKKVRECMFALVSVCLAWWVFFYCFFLLFNFFVLNLVHVFFSCLLAWVFFSRIFIAVICFVFSPRVFLFVCLSVFSFVVVFILPLISATCFLVSLVDQCFLVSCIVFIFCFEFGPHVSLFPLVFSLVIQSLFFVCLSVFSCFLLFHLLFCIPSR